jgi:xanthine dehydrogenase accessory factor
MSETRTGLVLVRGAGDLATGVILRLVRSGFRVVALEAAAPTAIRRTVAFSEAVYEGEALVEGLAARLAASADEAKRLASGGLVPVLVDPRCESLRELRPMALVDAIMAKRNLGTNAGMAGIVVALGPGFSAPSDAHAVIETNTWEEPSSQGPPSPTRACRASSAAAGASASCTRPPPASSRSCAR